MSSGGTKMVDDGSQNEQQVQQVTEAASSRASGGWREQTEEQSMEQSK